MASDAGGDDNEPATGSPEGSCACGDSVNEGFTGVSFSTCALSLLDSETKPRLDTAGCAPVAIRDTAGCSRDEMADRGQKRRPACFNAFDARLAMVVFHWVAWREMMSCEREELFGGVFLRFGFLEAVQASHQSSYRRLAEVGGSGTGCDWLEARLSWRIVPRALPDVRRDMSEGALLVNRDIGFATLGGPPRR